MIERVGEGDSGRDRLQRVGGEPRVPPRVFVAFAVLTVVWLGATPQLLLGALLNDWHVLGQVPTAAQDAAARGDALLGAVLAAGCPGLAWLLAQRWQLRTARAVFGVGAVLGLVGGLLAWATVG